MWCWSFIVVAIIVTFTERERSSDWMEGGGKEEVTSHPEEVLVTVILVPFPIGCRVVTVVKA